MTETQCRYYYDVVEDINSDTDAVNQFSIADGWEVATRDQFHVLMAHWFEFINPNDGTYQCCESSTHDEFDVFLDQLFMPVYLYATEQFVQTFGDTYGSGEVSRGSLQGPADLNFEPALAVIDIYNLEIVYGDGDDNEGTYLVRAVQVPKPFTLGLLTLGLLGIGARKRKTH